MANYRQLAAIMFTDIQGYTSLMQRDEELAINIRDRHREIFRSAMAKHNGKILQYFGDGTLSIFNSVIEAVKCGIEMQLAFRQQHPPIQVRIGIHLGDIVYNENEIIGDGVNITSRIESMAAAGSVFISSKVYDEIKNQSSIQTRSMGYFEFKNVDVPMEIFAIANEGLVVPTRHQLGGKTTKGRRVHQNNVTTADDLKRRKSLFALVIFIALIGVLAYKVFDINKVVVPDEKSVAVLPFTNLSGNAEDEYFSDGVTEDIITSLAKVSDLKVISRTSSMLYKGTNKQVQQIGKELRVDALVEGSVRKSGNQVKIMAALIDVKSDNNLWSTTFNIEIDQVFRIQSEVAQLIAQNLEAQLTDRERDRIEVLPTNSMKAYDYLLQGRALQYTNTLDNNYKAIELFRKAINIDPSFAEAYARIGGCYITLGSWIGELDTEIAADSVDYYLGKALLLDPDLAVSHSHEAYNQFFFKKNFAAAEEKFLLAYELDPSEIINIAGYQHFLNCMGRFEESLTWWEKGSRIDPMSIWNHFYKGTSYFLMDKKEKGLDYYRTALKEISYHPVFYDKMGWVLYNTGSYEEAIQIINEGLKKFKIKSPSMMGYLALAYYQVGDIARSNEIVGELKERYKNKDKEVAFFLGVYYSGIQDKEQAFEWLERSYERKDVELIWLKVEPQLTFLHDDPRYQDLLTKVGFKN